MRSSSVRSGDVVKVCLAVFAGFILIACSPTEGDDQKTNAGPVPLSTATSNAAPVTPASENSPTTTPLSPRLPAPPPARDPDQEFLRHMLDHNETVLATVHAQMMEPAGHAEHGMAADPAGWDAKIDANKQEMLALLKKHYNEDYSPRASPPSSTVGSVSSGGMAGMSMPPVAAGQKAEADPMAGQMLVAAQLRDGVAMADRFAPRLKQPEVRDLARRIRASQLKLARELGAGMPSR